MREGWTYKKLGEICDVINGLWVGKKEPFINVAVIRNTNFSKDCKLNLDNVAYIDVEAKQFATRKLKVGDIIIEKSGGSDKQPVGRPIIFNVPNGDYSFSNFTSALRIKEKGFNPQFLHLCLYEYYRNGETKKMQSKTTGLRNLDMKAYLKMPIPCCEIVEQKKIVAELDLLSSVIEKKKAQLEEYDQLAQSIFYDMFGDPVTNENGWETIDFEDALEKVKYTNKIQSSKYLTNGLIPIISQEEEYISGYWNDENDAFKVDIPLVIFGDHSRVIKYVDFDFVLGADGVKILKPKKSINARYLFSFLKCYNVPSLGYSRHYKLLKEIKLPIPPLSLQQQFAEKIETIERQKELIKQSIAETEILFNSRMDYYFN